MLLIAWIAKARQALAQENLSAFHAVMAMTEIDNPNRNIVEVKIDTFLYGNTKDLHTFLR